MLLPGRNKVEGRIPPAGLVFAPCALVPTSRLLQNPIKLLNYCLACCPFPALRPRTRGSSAPSPPEPHGPTPAKRTPKRDLKIRRLNQGLASRRKVLYFTHSAKYLLSTVLCTRHPSKPRTLK